jgi:hypothetical protein
MVRETDFKKLMSGQRPRSAMGSVTAISGQVLRASIGSNTDLPTPAPAKTPPRRPRQVAKASRALAPRTYGRADAGVRTGRGRRLRSPRQPNAARHNPARCGLYHVPCSDPHPRQRARDLDRQILHGRRPAEGGRCGQGLDLVDQGSERRHGRRSVLAVTVRLRDPLIMRGRA